MRLERVLQMPVAEVAGRGRQEASKVLDRVTARERRRAAVGLPDHVWERFPARFFAGAAGADTAR
jgi:hypothetical protein